MATKKEVEQKIKTALAKRDAAQKELDQAARELARLEQEEAKNEAGT